MVGDALQLGASIVIAIFLGAAIGYWLDKWLGTFPYLSVVFFLLGVAAAGRNVWIVVRKELRRDREREEDGKKEV